MKGVVVANADQTPEYSDIRHTGHEKGDFLFVPLDIDCAAACRVFGRHMEHLVSFGVQERLGSALFRKRDGRRCHATLALLSM